MMNTTYADDDYELTGLPAGNWRMVTDQVMGGVSQGGMSAATRLDEPCIALQGKVSTQNNGGFIQIVRELDANDPSPEDYSGISLEVFGNAEAYNLHLRTSDLWLPWQSYRATFNTSPSWQRVLLPFADFQPYRTNIRLHIDRLQRIALVAIGREFQADVCIKDVAFYRPR